MPVPVNEMDRILTLANLDVDYTSLEHDFKDLGILATNIVGTEISIADLINNYTQWSVSDNTVSASTTSGKNTIAQPTLSIPLNINGQNVGSISIPDKDHQQHLSSEKVKMLQIIANEIITRLKTSKIIKDLHFKVKEVDEIKRRVVHDIRGPLTGVIGLANMVQEQSEELTMNEAMEYVGMMDKSANSVLELANDILTSDQKKFKPGNYEFNLNTLKDKLLELYEPQAINKHIHFRIVVHPEGQNIPFPKNKLLQIIGNLISNAMKFTAVGGNIIIDLSMAAGESKNTLCVSVNDDGVGMSAEKINEILNGKGKSTDGTGGEHGFGFGLALVKHLLETLNGSIKIESTPGKGTNFSVAIPQQTNLP